MSDLMELINACPTDKTKNDFHDEQIILDLRSLGFKAATNKRFKDLQRRKKHERIAWHNYRVVTNEAIEQFLERKVLIYNNQHPKPKSDIGSYVDFGTNIARAALLMSQGVARVATPSNDDLERTKIFFKISKATNDVSNYNGVGEYQWEEILVKNYPRLPPQHVLDEFKKHKERNLFDYFTIARVNEIPDPILFGRIKEDKKRRWFIAQWGEDICIDDLVTRKTSI